MKLATARVGNGSRTIIMLHGFLGSGRNLSSLARSWTLKDPSRSFLLMDLTGHGSSPPLSPDSDVHTMARDVMETANAEGLAPPYTIVGHSLGGRVALAATLQAPHAIRHVTLLDIAPGPIGDAGQEQSRTLQAFTSVPASFARREDARDALRQQGLSQAMTEWLLMNLTSQGDSYVWKVDRHALLSLRPKTLAVDLWPAVERYGQAMRCIRGGQSPYVSEDDVRRYEQFGCHVVTIPNAGHFVHVDQPTELVEHLVAETP